MKYLANNEHKIKCERSFKLIDIRHLISDITDQSARYDILENERRDNPVDDHLRQYLTLPSISIYNNTQANHNNTYQYGKRDNFVGDQVRGNKIGVQNNKLPEPALPVSAANPSAPTLFISYARKDGSLAAQRLRTELTSAGFTIWQDTQDMQGGKEWKAQLRTILKQVDTVLVLMTPAAVASKYVEWEWDTAQSFEKTVIPIKISDCDVPDELQRLHYRDLSTQANYSNTLMTIVRDLRH